MGIREQFKNKPGLAAATAGGLLVLAIAAMVYNSWPEKKANLSQAFFSDNDGQTWFADSAYRVPPFEHNGKTAVGAAVYTYAAGKKSFCAYLMQYTPQGKYQLEKALADAQKDGKSPAGVWAFTDPKFRSQNLQVKRPGAGSWLISGDPNAIEIMTIRSPDGSEFDQCFVY